MQPPTVREVTRRLEREGWTLRHMRGDHRVYGRNGDTVSVPGNLNDHLKRGTYAAIKRKAGW